MRMRYTSLGTGSIVRLSPNLLELDISAFPTERMPRDDGRVEAKRKLLRFAQGGGEDVIKKCPQLLQRPPGRWI